MSQRLPCVQPSELLLGRQSCSILLNHNDYVDELRMNGKAWVPCAKAHAFQHGGGDI